MEFADSILEDLKVLDIVPDVVTHTSDHFDKVFPIWRSCLPHKQLLAFGTKMIENGFAYVDDLDVDTVGFELVFSL